MFASEPVIRLPLKKNKKKQRIDITYYQTTTIDSFFVTFFEIKVKTCAQPACFSSYLIP